MSGPSAIFARPPAIMPVTTLPGGRLSARAVQRRGHRWPGRISAFAVGVVLVLSPLPNGSNHPLLWLTWAFWCALAATLVSLVRPRPAALAARLTGWIGAGLVGVALFQALPLPGWRGGLPVKLGDGPAVVFSHLSIAPGATLLGALRQVGYVLFFQLALLAGKNPARARTLGWLMFVAVAMQAFYAIASLEWLGDRGIFAAKTAFAGMATGSFVSKNALADFLGMGLVLGLALSLSPQPPHHRPRHRLHGASTMAGLALLLIALALTQSRMGLAAGLAGSVLVLLRSGTQAGRRALLLIFGGLLILVLLGLMGNLGRLLNTGASPDPRADLYPQVVAMIARRPLSGFGLDSFPLAFEMFHAPPVTAGFTWDKAHSVYLSFWVEMGVIAGSLPLLAGAIAAGALWQRTRATGTGASAQGRTMALAALAALGLVALHGLVDFAPRIPANTYFLLGLIGLALGPDQPQERGP